jgi:hypothetical protein
MHHAPSIGTAGELADNAEIRAIVQQFNNFDDPSTTVLPRLKDHKAIGVADVDQSEEPGRVDDVRSITYPVRSAQLALKGGGDQSSRSTIARPRLLLWHTNR